MSRAGLVSLIFSLLCIGLVASVPLPGVLSGNDIVMSGPFWCSDSDYMLISAHTDLRFMGDMTMLQLRETGQAMTINIFDRLRNTLERYEASFFYCAI